MTMMLVVVALQVMGEVQGFLKFLGEVYSTFGLDYSMALSTRPESYLVRTPAFRLDPRPMLVLGSVFETVAALVEAKRMPGP